MRTATRLSGLAMGALLLLGVAAMSEAQMKFRFAHGFSTEESMHLGAVEFAKKVAQKTGNAINIEIYPAGQLGNDPKMLEGIRLGSMDLGMAGNPIFAAFAPEMTVLDLPYLFRDYAHVYKVIDGPIGQEVLQAVEKHGLKGLGTLEGGFRNITNSKHPVKTPEDVRGLKIRTMPNPAHLQAFRLLGANPVPMPITEVYLALKTGTVDGQENPVTLVEAMKFYEAQKYMSLTLHAYTVADVVMNLKKYQELKPEYQKALHEALHEVAIWQRKLNRENEGTALAKMKTAGLQVEERPDIEAFRRIVAGPVAEEYVKKFGRETLDKIRNIR